VLNGCVAADSTTPIASPPLPQIEALIDEVSH